MAGFLNRVKLDARPDRIDFRDKPYQPPLVSLPPSYPDAKDLKKYLPQYGPRILNQKREDSCTGHGLAAVINYIHWERWVTSGAKRNDAPPLVSPHMIYNNARLYDEWEGEDYGGSSCRGGMKGWFKHGVCERELWRAEKERPQPAWKTDAASRPLGAYYRVDSKSILELQAAICEVHAVYCSADVHSGWDMPKISMGFAGFDLKVIKPGSTCDGGHAFAMVGYTPEGFIIQNSWGPEWGTSGFALLTYEDWIVNGSDAWVAAMGAPIGIAMKSGAPATLQRAGMTVNLAFAATKSNARRARSSGESEPWSESKAYEHAIVMGNDGKLIRRLLNAPSAEDNLQFVAVEAVAASKLKKVALYVHGGLNDEEHAIERARRMGPWFEKNGIYPLFIVWRTGVLETLNQIAQDDVKLLEERMKAIRSKGLGDVTNVIIDRAKEAFDRAFEVAAEKALGKAVWSQMKQNAEKAAASPQAGIAALVGKLAQHRNIEFHALGHSAGAILLGHLLTAGRGTIAFKTLGLYAPACTLEFATRHYGQAFESKTLAAGGLRIDYLSDEAEAGDSVGAYGKSLLYLVSRALEEKHKTPILGLDIALRRNGKGPLMQFDPLLHKPQHQAWQAIIDKFGVKAFPCAGPKAVTRWRPSKIEIDVAHGSFDNDTEIFTHSLAHMLGRKPDVPVADLSGF
jgi:Papain family cysteine protease